VADELGYCAGSGSWTGICYDNAWAESFNGTLKTNGSTVPSTRHGSTQERTSAATSNCVNQIRLHSAIGYRTPNEVESEWRSKERA
jgi:transposase InsO family protein